MTTVPQQQPKPNKQNSASLQLLSSPVPLHRGSPNADLPHVLLIVDQFAKTLGGGERIVLRLAALLPQYGYRVSILTFLVHPESSILSAPPPCPVYLLPLGRTYDLHALRAAMALRQFLNEQKVRIAETFFESSDLWAGLVVKLLSSTKLVWSRRDMGILRGRKHEIAYRFMARLPDRVFAVSEQVRQHCIEVDGIDPSRVQTIYNGLDLPEAVSSQPVHSGPMTFTTIGNIRRVKGHDLMVRAAAIVLAKFPETSFNVAGEVLDQDYFEELRSLTRELGISERFHFVGGISNVGEHLQTADVFVLPSRSEGFSNAIVEAMAASLPVIATDVGGNAEAVIHDVTGLVTPTEDHEALAAAMIHLCRYPALAARMGATGAQVVVQKFTTGAMLGHIDAAFKMLLV